MADLKIPIQLQLRRATLAIVAPGPIRAVFGGPSPPPPTHLKVVEDGALGDAARLMKVIVSLSKTRGADFPASELWIEPVDGQAPPTRSKTLTLALDGEFLVRFSPTGNANFGHHEYQLDARLAGQDERQAVPAKAPVSIEYQYPSLDLSAPSVKVSVPKGGARRATVKAFLHGPVAMTKTVEFRPDPSGRAESITVELASQTATVTAGDVGTLLTLDVKASESAKIGRHTIRGVIADREGGAKDAPLDVIALVDELTIADRTANVEDVRKPIPVELWFGASHTRRLVLGTATKAPLPGPIEIAGAPDQEKGRQAIAIAVDPKDDNGRFLLPRRAILKSVSKEEGGQGVTLEFPAMINVDANHPYRVFLDLLPGPDTGLSPRVLEFEVRYRRTDDLKPAAP